MAGLKSSSLPDHPFARNAAHRLSLRRQLEDGSLAVGAVHRGRAEHMPRSMDDQFTLDVAGIASPASELAAELLDAIEFVAGDAVGDAALRGVSAALRRAEEISDGIDYRRGIGKRTVVAVAAPAAERVQHAEVPAAAIVHEAVEHATPTLTALAAERCHTIEDP